MKKWLSLLIVGFFCKRIWYSRKRRKQNRHTLSQTITEHVPFAASSLQVVDSTNNYVLVRFKDEEPYLMNTSQPMVPRLVKHYELPFGATNVEVEVQPGNIDEQILSKEIRPAPVPHTPRTTTVLITEKDTRVYTSDAFYPEAWFGSHFGCSLNAKGDHVTHVTVNLFPMCK